MKLKNPNEFMMIEANKSYLCDIHKRNYSFYYLHCNKSEKEQLEYIEENLPSKKINYIVHDATIPLNNKTIIMHIVNNIGLFGAGFAGALATKYPIVRKAYLEYLNIDTESKKAREGKSFLKELLERKDKFLGDCLLTRINPDLYVVHLFAQDEVRSKTNPHPIDYIALDAALRRFHYFASSVIMDMDKPDDLLTNYKIQAPALGSGLASGDWKIINKIIKRTIMSLDPNFDITVCLLKTDKLDED